MRKIVWILLPLVILIVGLIMYKVVSADTTNNIPTHLLHEEEPAMAAFDVAGCLVKTGSADTPYQFQSVLYLDSAHFTRALYIRNDLLRLDSLTHDESFNRKTLSAVLTNELTSRTREQYKVYQPDSLLRLLQWAEQFQYYAAMDPHSRIFYKSVYSYWLNFIADKLITASVEQPSLKYDFKFKYLMTRCREQQYTMGVKVTSLEKFLENIIYSKWGHLLSATWNQTTWLMKFGFLIIAGIFLFGLYSIIKPIINRKIVKQ